MNDMEIIFESDIGIRFELIKYKNRCKVTVRNKSYNNVLRIYRFDNVPFFESPYLSWENLNCCGGWVCDDNYLLTAVQNNKKLCAQNFFRDKLTANQYYESLDNKYLGYIYDTSWKKENDTYRFVDVVRGGCIADYIQVNKIFDAYANQNIDYVNKDVIIEYLNTPIIDLVKNKERYNYVSPKTDEELIVTGLLLGYPLESTASIINGY